MSEAWPIGAAIEPATLGADPYAAWSRLREHEPVSWVQQLGMFYVTRHEDVAAILKDHETFAVGADDMLVYDTFGRHMMTIDGPEQVRMRLALRGPFAPKSVRERLESQIAAMVDRLIDDFRAAGSIELRRAFACRLPVQVMLSVFGLPAEDETLLRRWYDAFEAALANYTWDPQVRARAKSCVGEFKAHMRARLNAPGALPRASLFAALLETPADVRLNEEEILQNALIIFFGGISTVEALILNTLYALALHREVMERVRTDREALVRVVEESARWLSPVQAATRVVTRDVEVAGVAIKSGSLINCILGSANRDPRVFADADAFNIDRENLSRHLAFATGPHTCLGSNLARAEVRIALSRLMDRLPNCNVDLEKTARPSGYEFLQPSALVLRWRV
ncbi:MAG: cytochrome P450 [Hyphomonadaceae bacterium JAD_PAG50586_4]|nr:MAG: cytochrome P450 [Hyphomonadaceae bacterium JAD_PAG50586_4]